MSDEPGRGEPDEAIGPAPVEQVTELLVRMREHDDPAARERLLELVYHELRGLARRRMAQCGGDHSIEPTGLVHEAVIRLLGRDDLEAVDRHHFLAIASRAMRDILVDRARKRDAMKRGGGWGRVPLDGVPSADGDVDLLALNEALEQLEAVDRTSAQIVTYRYFAGLTREETAALMGISPATVSREWAYARAWLRRRLPAPGAADHEPPAG